MLSSGASWTSINDQEDTGVTGYLDATPYTFTLTLNRTATTELLINATMAGGSLGGDGLLFASFTDTTPNSFAYDTFSLRPSGSATSATSVDTTAFSITLTSIPEPASYATLAGIAVLGLVAARRRRTAA